MAKELILGLDIGSSGVRAALYDIDANPIKDSLVKIERTLRVSVDGASEIDTDLAVNQVVTAIDQILIKSNEINGIIGHVASCSFWHSLVAVDAGGNHTPVVLGWADTRSRGFTDVLRNQFDENNVHNRTGARFHSSFWPAKLMWLRSEFPDAFSQATELMSFSDLLGLRIFDESATSVSMASGTGIFDARECKWDPELVAYLKLKPAMLPTIAADDQSFKLNKEYAQRWPRLAHAKWLPTIADGVANSIGSGCIDENRAALMVGTSGAMRVVYKGEPPRNIPDGLWCYRVDRERVIVGGALSDGGGIYDWLRRNLRIELSDDAICKEMACRGANAHGLTFMPFLGGERSTGYNENATGAIHGLTMAHDAIDILQSGMESVAYRFADIFDQLKSIFPDIVVVASGGALNASPVWTQMIADVLGRNLGLSTVPEASLHGAVLLALASTGKIVLTDKISQVEQNQISFHPECHSIYETARRRHENFYESYHQTQ